MNKFYILVVMPNLKLQKTWADADIVVTILNEYKGCKIYRTANDQEAVIVDNQVFWLDVPNVEKVNYESDIS